MMLDVIKWLKKLKDAISQMSDLIYSHSGRHKPGGADTLFPADYNIEPNSDNVYDIGSNNNSWRRIHGYVHRLKPTSPPTSPLEGDLIYDGNEKVLKYYDGTGWRTAGGVSKLSELEIDVDKDWGGHSITNLNELHCTTVYASSLVRVGDLEFRNGYRITEDERYGIILISPEGKKYRLKLEEVD